MAYYSRDRYGLQAPCAQLNITAADGAAYLVKQVFGIIALEQIPGCR